MKKFLIASFVAYFSILIYLYGVFFQAVKLIDTPNKAEIASNFGIYIIGFIIIPPIVGALSYLITSRYIGNPHRHPILFLPYYTALYYISDFISLVVIGNIFHTNEFDLFGWETIPFLAFHFLIITMMVYVVTPRSR